MSSSVNRIITANLTTQKKKGSALTSALGSAFSQSKIAGTKTSSLSTKKKG